MSSDQTVEDRIRVYRVSLDAAIAGHAPESRDTASEAGSGQRAHHLGTLRADGLQPRTRPGQSRWARVVPLAAAATVMIGVAGIVVLQRADRGEAPPTPAESIADSLFPAEPSVYPLVGDQAGSTDFGSVSFISANNPERVMALIAIRNGDTLRSGLTVIAQVDPVATDASVVPPTSAPAEAVGTQRFDVHGRWATVWTEPGDARVQHVRFDSQPSLELAGRDALAFAQNAGPDAVRVQSVPDPGVGSSFTLEIGQLPAPYELIVDPFRAPTNAVEASINVGATDTAEGGYVGVSLQDPLPNAAAYRTLTVVDVNGISGWIDDGPGNYVHWEPEPGTFATAGGVATADEAIAMARTVRFVDRATWQNFYDVADPRLGPPVPSPATVTTLVPEPLATIPVEDLTAIGVLRVAVDTPVGRFEISDHPDMQRTSVYLRTGESVVGGWFDNSTIDEGLAWSVYGSSQEEAIRLAWGLAPDVDGYWIEIAGARIEPDEHGIWYSPVDDSITTLTIHGPNGPVTVILR
jgi:hypothetical protein